MNMDGVSQFRKVFVGSTSDEMAIAAAKQAAELLRSAINKKGEVTFVAATGRSQIEFLDALTGTSELDWSSTIMFHLDEYIGLSDTHPASFRRFLKNHLISRVQPGQAYMIQGDAPVPLAECEQLNRLLSNSEIDVAFVGIGENGHLAFNDPPADFITEDPYILVELDEVCRRQQVNEGWFAAIEEVPRRAISMSIRQIMKSSAIICTVPDERKAKAVRDCFTGEVTPLHPASILQQHEQAYLFLDSGSASLILRPN